MGSPTLSSQPKGYHARMDDNDNNMHYPKGFISADDNSFIVKGNDSELAYHLAPQVAKVKIESADLLTLDSTPIEIVSAQGSGKVIVPLIGAFWYDYGTSDYTFSKDLVFRSSSGNNTGFGIDNATLNVSNDFAGSNHWLGSQENIPPNESIVATTDGTVSGGDGDLFIYFRYLVIEQW
jgi:hypothetical protein